LDRPEIAERQVDRRLDKHELPVTAEIELREAAHGKGVALKLPARLRLPVDQPGEAGAAVGVPQPPGIVGVVARRLPSGFDIEEPVPARLPKPQVRHGAVQGGAVGIVIHVVRVGTLEEMVPGYGQGQSCLTAEDI